MMRYATAGKILVVDDETQNVDVLRRLMTRLDYEVLTASNGESAGTVWIHDAGGARRYAARTCSGGLKRIAGEDR
jgi:CheY-like chemotaxis protein